MLGLMLGTEGVGHAGRAGLSGKATALVNRRTGRVLATSVEIARTRATRRRGLLGRDSMDPSGAFLLSPCCAIHTAFMRFAIDVVFVDKRGSIVSILHELQPWNRRSETGKNDSAFRGAKHRLQPIVYRTFGWRVAAAFRICAIGEKSQHALFAVSGEGMEIEGFSVDRCWIDFEVTGMDDRSHRRPYRERKRVDDGVGDVEELDIEWA